MVDDLVPLIKKAERDKAVNGIMEAIGVPSAEDLAEIVDGAPDQIREAFHDAMERNVMYAAHSKRMGEKEEAETGLSPDTCCNVVCPEYYQKLRHGEDGDMQYTTVIGELCKKGDEAVSCLYRMKDHPISDPFVNYPSHNEAIQMLQRAGLLTPDDFGKYDGTDFAHKKNTRKIWWTLVRLLVDAGKIPETFVEGCEDSDRGPMKDMGQRSADAKKHLGF